MRGKVRMRAMWLNQGDAHIQFQWHETTREETPPPPPSNFSKREDQLCEEVKVNSAY